MRAFFENSIFFGAAISLLAYLLGMWIRKKLKLSIFNPLLISIVVTIIFLATTGIDYDKYYEGAKYISYLLTPATVCLSIALYEQLSKLKKHWKAIILGIISGVISSLGTVLGMCFLFGMTHKEYVTLLPKSITTAIAMPVCEQLGGYVPITVAVIVITGVVGYVFADAVLKLFKITDPVAKGVALGTSCHALGTVKAIELGEIEGAMSSLSIVVAGIITVVGASVFANFM